MTDTSSADLSKDEPLKDDIRLLGRILGDTIREQEGEVVFGLIERIRQTSIRFRRDDDLQAKQELETLLNSLSPEQSRHVALAFSYFSHLSNIAEDQHHIRRSRSHALAGSIQHEGNLAFHPGLRLAPASRGAHDLADRAAEELARAARLRERAVSP